MPSPKVFVSNTCHNVCSVCLACFAVQCYIPLLVPPVDKGDSRSSASRAKLLPSPQHTAHFNDMQLGLEPGRLPVELGVGVIGWEPVEDAATGALDASVAVQCLQAYLPRQSHAQFSFPKTRASCS